jgi:hypothetical protein
MMKRQTITQQKSQRGQSLVEVALFFPIFIILLAGLVEVSQLLITQNRVSSAARAGTRFASDGGEDAGIVTVFTPGDSREPALSSPSSTRDSGPAFHHWILTHP